MTDSIPLVSVVMPVYNSMPYLTATLESVLAQDVAGLEVIAVDDGSTDGSGEELDCFAARDHRLTVIHQPNSGWPGAPRNRGIERATGEFVFFMDSDDTLAPHALSAMVEMAQTRNAEVVIPRMQGVAGRGVQQLFQLHPHGPISIARAMETLSPQKLFRRDLIERDGLRFPEERVRLEDGIFVTRAYVLAREIAFCGRKPLYFIALRDDGGNISTQGIDPENYVSSCRRIARILLDGVPDRKQADQLVLQFFGRKGLRFYAPKRWLRMDDARKREWVELHRQFLEEFVPTEVEARTSHPTDLQKTRLIRAGDVAGLDRLISAAAALEHDSRVSKLVLLSRAAELTVTITPAEPRPEGGSWLADARIADWRLRAADRLHRLLRPAMGSRLVRGASRRVADLVVSGAPRVQLLISGRKAGRRVSVPGRIASYDAAGALRYRFVLPEDLLQRFGKDRVDLWTVAEVDGLSGGSARVSAGVVRKSGTKIAPGVEVYATTQGNATIRRIARP